MINQSVKVGVNGRSDVIGRCLHLTDLILQKKFEGPEVKEVIEFNKRFASERKNNPILVSKQRTAEAQETPWYETGLYVVLGIALAPFSMGGCASEDDNYHTCIKTYYCPTDKCYYDHEAEERCECSSGYHLDCDDVGCECIENPQPHEKNDDW